MYGMIKPLFPFNDVAASRVGLGFTVYQHVAPEEHTIKNKNMLIHEVRNCKKVHSRMYEDCKILILKNLPQEYLQRMNGRQVNRKTLDPSTQSENRHRCVQMDRKIEAQNLDHGQCKARTMHHRLQELSCPTISRQTDRPVEVRLHPTLATLAQWGVCEEPWRKMWGFRRAVLAICLYTFLIKWWSKSVGRWALSDAQIIMPSLHHHR
ncbi:hypothetical protein HD554DRAFT_2035572 [Boletus coccyginus]|nr:hypothetical protein HD554DRAFT_2035572 [Boletus coccyginus]